MSVSLLRTGISNHLLSEDLIPPHHLFNDNWYTIYMSEESACIYNQARRNEGSSVEAWENLQSLTEDTDWDVERMLSESPTSTDADRELPL